jgi:hypothetical protein
MSVLSRRRLAKAMRPPSGDHTGAKYSPWAGVSRFSAVPSPATTKIPGAPKRRLAKASWPGPSPSGRPLPPVPPDAPAPVPVVELPAAPGAVLPGPGSPALVVEPDWPVSGPGSRAVEAVVPAVSGPSPSSPPEANATTTATPTATTMMAAPPSTAVWRRHQAGPDPGDVGSWGEVDTVHPFV